MIYFAFLLFYQPHIYLLLHAFILQSSHVYDMHDAADSR